MASFSRGIYESDMTTYNQEEKLLFEVTSDVRGLIADLEKAEIKIDENEA